MASLLDSFRNSSMPKRLLRYALSRFDVLDADALNLDNLDLAWGRNTVLEFRDVGLKLNILQHLLQLPPTFHIRKAKVALLRVVLPVDIYSSPIQIHVTGVDVRLRVSKDSNGSSSSDGAGKRRTSKSAGSPADDEDAVPTAADLAQSFLEHQPSDEKKALEDALAYADDINDDDDDDSTSSSSQTLGTGQALTLPAFLTGFLQGIVNRTQVNIEGVTFQLEVDVPIDAASTAAAATGPGTTPGMPIPANVEPVTFQLALSRINVEGVTTTASTAAPVPGSSPNKQGQDSDAKDEHATATRSPFVSKEGKRHISLENVRAFLISEANVFSTLARSPSMPLSLASRSPSIPSQGPLSRSSTASSKSGFPSHIGGSPVDSPPRVPGSPNVPDDVYGQGAISVAASRLSSAAASSILQNRYPLQDSEDAFNIPYEMGSSSDENDSPAEEEATNTPEDELAAATVPASSSSTPRASIYGDVSHLPISSSATQLPPHAAQSAIVHSSEDRGGLQWSAWSQEAQSEPSLPSPLDLSSSSHEGSVGLGLVGEHAVPAGNLLSTVLGGHGSAGSSDAADSAADLTESRVFSHEEAESMYMSAFSQTESVRLQNTAAVAAMPGGWENDSGDYYGTSSHAPSSSVPHVSSGHSGYSSPKFELARASSPPVSTAPDAPTTFLGRDMLASLASDGKDPSAATYEAMANDVADDELGLSVHTAGAPSPKVNDGLHPSEAIQERSKDSDSPMLSMDPEPIESLEGSEDLKGQPDEAATPRGPARLVKEILSLQYISIYVPSTHEQIDIAQQPIHGQRQHDHQSHDNLGRSVAPHLPGAFSIYSSAGASSVAGDSSFHARLDDSQFMQPASTDQRTTNDASVEVTLAPLEIRFDASIGFLLAMVVSELVQSLNAGLEQKSQEKQQRSQGAAASRSGREDASVAMPDIRFHAEKISLLFLDKLAGVANTAERFFDSPRASSFNPRGDILLQAVLDDLVIGLTPTSKMSSAVPMSPATSSRTNTAVETVMETHIDLRRFRFGYSDADILSFDRRIQMRASVRDIFPPSGDDISVKISQSTQKFKCEINTLPLLVSLDLQRLDETFSWFGGLSSFLSMGSSITSAASQGSGRPSSAKALSAPSQSAAARGVRFEAPINPDDRSVASENKIDMRVGGIHLDLIGRDCRVGLDTSAVKMVNREEGIGVGVSRIRLAGPYLRNSGGDPPVMAEVSNTRLEFLNVPKEKDLERLLELITPSRVKFDEREDVIMVDTLLRQRRSGPLLRLSVDDVNIRVQNMGQLACLPMLSEEIARLATVAKYLPEDDRPGLLTLGLLRRIDVSVDVGGRLGLFQASIGDLEVAHITIPSLMSVALGTLSVHRNHSEELIGSSVVPAAASVTPTAGTTVSSSSGTASSASPNQVSGQSPALMLRIIGDDMEPVIKIKMWGLNFEYRVPTIMDVLDLAVDATPQDFEASLAASVANLGEQAHTAIANNMHGTTTSQGTGASAKAKGKTGPDTIAKPTTLDLSFRDCVVGLNPLGLTSKLNIVLVDARLEVAIPQADEEVDAVVHLSKISLLLIDDVSNLAPTKEVAFAPSHVAQRRSSGGAGFLSQPTFSNDMVSRLCSRGFVDICQISAAKVSAHVSAPDADGQKTIDLEIRDDLLVLETCADSTQTLITLANALKPPTPPSKEIKFKTQVMPVKDLLASISIDAFGRAEGNYNFDEDFIMEEDEGEGTLGISSEDDDQYGGEPRGFASQDHEAIEQSVTSLPSAVADDDLLLEGDLDDLDVEGIAPGTVVEKLFNASSVFSAEPEEPEERSNLSPSRSHLLHPDGTLLDSGRSPVAKPVGSPLASSVSELGAEENYFGTASATANEETSHANRWNSAQNNYDKSKVGPTATGGTQLPAPPLRVRVRDVHFIWNLFDGYDWQHTRDVITKTVAEVEAKAYERRARNRRSGHDQYNPYSDDEEEEAVIGDYLFNSIYIGIPANHDPRQLTQAINQDLYGDTAGDTESVAATTVTAASSRAGGGSGGGRRHDIRGPRTKKLKLHRSRRHKITFELGGVAADLVVYPPGSGETQSSIDVRVHDLDVFDHVPTSTWKKFATYDRDAGERPIDGDMVHIEVLVVKPVPELAATEFVLKVAVLPLRLHVDQDALDFITRFFEFKDDTAPPTHASPSDVPFIQRAEIRDIPVQLDFKPKRVDYAGLRSGHTTEFMNFLILDSSRMTMRHTIIYGVSGFDRLGKTLNDIWMPDIQRHQLPGVLAGLAPVRSLVTVGSGFKDLIEIPIQEYRHNGRIVRSISKGAMAFAKSTGTELVKLGAKVATGTQYVLQGAEGMLNKNNPDAQGSGMGDISGGGGDDDSDDERKQISLYADQPTGVVQGLRHGYAGLARDLYVARDAIIAVPAEVRESTSAAGAAKIVMRHAPTIIFRPAIGATKAIGQTLMGATNSLDPQNLRRVEDKYKSGPGRRI